MQYEYRDEMEQDHSREFLTVGSMGHATSIAYGIALAKQVQRRSAAHIWLPQPRLPTMLFLRCRAARFCASTVMAPP